MKPPFSALALGLSVSFAASVSAQGVAGWQHETSASGVHLAYFTAAQQELTIRCRNNAVEVVYYVDSASLDPVMVGRLSAVLTFLIDDSDELQWTPGRVLADPGVVMIGAGGQPADEVARSIAKAKKSVIVSILTEPPRGGAIPYNRTQFPVDGAADAIRAAYAGCGIRF